MENEEVFGLLVSVNPCSSERFDVPTYNVALALAELNPNQDKAHFGSAQ